MTRGVLFLALAASALAQVRLKDAQFVYVADINADTNIKRNPQTGCANRPYTHDARIWSVTLSLGIRGVGSLKPMTGLEQTGAYVDASGVLYYAVADVPATGSFSISNRGRTHDVAIVNLAGQVRMEIPRLTLAEVPDIVEAVTQNSPAFARQLANAGYSIKLYRIVSTPPRLAEEVHLDVFGALQPNEYAPRLEQFAAGKGLPPGLRVELVDSTPLTLASIDQKTIDALNTSVASLWESGPRRNGNEPPVFVIDEPCLGFSVTPLLSGAEQSLATTFRARWDLYSAGGQSFIKFRGNGDTDIGGGYFNRGEAKVDIGVNNKGLVKVAGGAMAGYSFSRAGTKTVDEWVTGGKFQVHLPALAFRERPGALTRPIVNFEGGASGGNRLRDDGSIVRKTSFLARGTFDYIVRPSARLSLDFNGAIGGSDKEVFGDRKYFSNARVQIRMNVTKDYDFIARYDCGRRNPDYLKYCGWQTGFAVVTGR